MEENEKEEKKESKKRVNVGARTGMIAPVVCLGCTAVIAIYTYFQDFPLVWWLIIFFASIALFLLLGSVLQTVVELFVERVVKREEEEKRLRELAAEAGVEELDDGIVNEAAAESISE